jgi:glycosyltransferase involved in cell wall biosynthesis
MKTDASNHSMLEAHLELPENYVLYHGSGVEAALHRLLSAWSWVAGPVGEVYPLLVVGLEVGSRQRLEHLAHQYGVGESVRAITPFSPTESALLYQRCTALFHPELPAAWGDPLLHALACGKPIVGIESPGSDQRLGPAAYLAPADDSRAQGAALLSVLVEDVIREQLSAAAGQRRLAWEDPGASLGALWKSV